MLSANFAPVPENATILCSNRQKEKHYHYGNALTLIILTYLFKALRRRFL